MKVKKKRLLVGASLARGTISKQEGAGLVGQPEWRLPKGVHDELKLRYWLRWLLLPDHYNLMRELISAREARSC